MEMTCPHCQIRMKWSEKYWGKKVRCPKCKQIFVIQKPLEEGSTPASYEPQTQQPKAGEKDDCQNLQRAADYFLIKKALGSYFWVGYTVAAIIYAIIMAIKTQSHQGTYFFIFIAFLCTSVLAIWLLALLRPYAIMMVLQGTLLVLWGVIVFLSGIISWKTWYAAFENARSLGGRPPDIPPSMFAPFIFGLVAVIWGILQYSRYVQFRNRPIEKPECTIMELVKKIAKSIDSANPEASSNIIKFVVETFWGRRIWKVELSENRAVFVRAGLEDIIFSEKERVRITKRDEAKYGGRAVGAAIWHQNHFRQRSVAFD